MRNRFAIMGACLTLAICGGCPNLPPTETVTTTFEFSNGALGWTADFSDYSIVEEESLEFDSGVRPLPDELGDGTGLFAATTNRSDDAFTYIKRQISPADTDGFLEPNQSYRLTFRIDFASNAPNGCAGVGGAPGEGVYLKAGGSTNEPMPEEQENEYIGLNVDKGQQSSGGPAATVLGNVANGDECDDPENAPYVSIEREGEHTADVTTDDDGQLWLLVGTDSAFESRTGLYYQRVEVTIARAGE